MTLEETRALKWLLRLSPALQRGYELREGLRKIFETATSKVVGVRQIHGAPRITMGEDAPLVVFSADTDTTSIYEIFSYDLEPGILQPISRLTTNAIDDD